MSEVDPDRKSAFCMFSFTEPLELPLAIEGLTHQTPDCDAEFLSEEGMFHRVHDSSEV